ncbi:hypothetical protein PVK06_045517 [Gossypium arboreum]|uniref:DUF4283 domain-containing protein n=1 Tax=Gossypium arboreum TaxID=29729 RepID=A0ABR0MU98_GOSAR|nr:hypothetical protein PVK06_045517 [Gossypium arboreum]
MENGIVATVFIYNIPTSTHWKGLWALFGYHGDVVDAFIPTKRCRNGQKDQEWSVEIVQEVKSKERLENNTGGDMKSKKRIVQGHIEDELLWNLQKCLVCELISVCDLKSLNDRIEKFGLREIIVRRTQGRHFLVEIPDKERMDLLRQTEWSYLRDFFIKIESWLKKLKINERVTWIEVLEVPLHCWNYETFNRVAGLWGKLVLVGENLTKVHNFKKIELLISLTQLNMVDELVSMEVDDDLFPIRVREGGLVEMKGVSLNSKARWKKNEEDSILESGSVARTRLEILSEGRESVKSGVLMDTNLENGNTINGCHKMLEMEIEVTESKYLSKEIKIGIADEADKGMERALKDVRDMCLDIVEDPIEDPKDGGIDNGLSMDVGCRKAGKSTLEENINPMEGNNNSQENETVRERKKRDKALHKEKEESFVRKMRELEVNNTWAIGKKLGFNVRHDEEDIIEEIMRAEIQ